MSHTLNWFEIYVQDLPRAVKFYADVMGAKLKLEEAGPTRMAIFEKSQDSDTTGALVQDGRRKPSADGTLVYMNANGKLDKCIENVARAGGTLVLPKTDIGEPGFIALFRDTEGNVVGLHSER